MGMINFEGNNVRTFLLISIWSPNWHTVRSLIAETPKGSRLILNFQFPIPCSVEFNSVHSSGHSIFLSLFS